MDLDLMPVEVEVEGLIVEVERPGVASEDADAEACRTIMAPEGFVSKTTGESKPYLFMSKSLEVKQESPSMQTLMVAIPTKQSKLKPVVKKIYGRCLLQKWNGKLLSGLNCVDLVQHHLVNFWR